MATLTPYSPQPLLLSSRSPSPTPEYITYSTSESGYQDNALDHDRVPLTGRELNRSSSPTPSELIELKEFDGTVVRMFRKKSWKNKSFLITIGVVSLFIAITVLIAVFQDPIVRALIPAAEWVKKTPGGFLIPIALLVILSIPPLFGADIIQLLCGFTYGIWLGFLIVCAGTVIGETINFYLFRSCLRSRAEKIERGKGSPRWGALARVIREGGFGVALAVRFSAFPSHVVTALFAVCGLNFWTFMLTLLLSLPRQLAGVYIGVLIFQTDERHPSKLDKKLSIVVLVITIVVTVIVMSWLNIKMRKVALIIIRERRAHEQARGSIEIGPFNPSSLYDASTATLNAPYPTSGRWSNESNANVFFSTRTPSPAPPNVPAGARLPAAPAPAQIHADVV
ncbi:hypothetical protein BDV93DRAFT_482326 [Ceratobasidium sp. AG-I]|nr:hypothetical protein BDV93DRAFT_482326 [Ceratobasidium sp. AG-I]